MTVYTMEQRWQDAFNDAMYHLWSKETLQIELKACQLGIEEYRELGYPIEVERLTLKVAHLDKIIKKKR